MRLHQYQQNCLDALAEYFERAAESGAKAAFVLQTERPYRSPPGLAEGTPFVCIRVPTGGGKTFMAAHAVGIAAREYLQTETPTCLWLAPSNAIVDQTIKALQDRAHPCRRALADAFGDIEAMPIADALRIPKSELNAGAVVIVATMQSLRIEKTAGRKIYDDNGQLMEHFDSADSGSDYSLANALKKRRPIVVVDEAHNMATPLSFESLARFAPSCVIEFTATPRVDGGKSDASSNILHQVSGWELKQAGMIKLPIELHVDNDWRALLQAAVDKRAALENEALAIRDDEYIRPIALYQAEAENREVTVDALRTALLEIKIPAKQIAVATGETRDLRGVDLFSEKCEIRHIITVRALAEGWDCSFGYVLCSFANFNSTTAVEQIIGRVLRMPRAQPKTRPALNLSFVFARADRFQLAADAVIAGLVNRVGLEKIEAEKLLPRENSLQLSLGEESPDAESPAPLESRKIKIPLLGVRRGETIDIFDDGELLDEKWDLSSKDAAMPDYKSPLRRVDKGEIDINERKIKAGNFTREARAACAFLSPAFEKWKDIELAAWIDRKVRRKDIAQTQAGVFILRAVRGLVARGRKLSDLVAHRFHLAESVRRKIDEHRDEERKRCFQSALTGIAPGGEKLEVSPQCAISIDEDDYAPHWLFEGEPGFAKHLFARVGELKRSGEECDCARFLDAHEKVEVWLRNLERRPETSFWLPTASDRFYPDFVARLRDGRFLVVEYKGADRWSNDDSKEKRDIGALWEEQSGEERLLQSGKQCLFVMPKGPDFAAIEDKIDGKG